MRRRQQGGCAPPVAPAAGLAKTRNVVCGATLTPTPNLASADGFKTIIESEVFPKGLSEDVVRAISAKKEEPEWLLEFRCVRRALWISGRAARAATVEIAAAGIPGAAA